MTLLEAIVLGLVQGLTEFLPISSSGHLRIVPALFGWDDPGAGFTAVVQLGTMAAVLLYFRSDLMAVTVNWTRSLWTPELRGSPPARLGWYLIAATVPIVVFGVAFQDQIETGARDLRVIATALIVMGLVLSVAEHVGRRLKTIDELRPRDGVLIGLAQSLALIPGVSRSGATISAGLFAGYTRADAARFSFLLSVPAVVLSGIYQLGDAIGGDGPGLPATLVATVVSFVAGYASIAWLLKWLVTHTFTIFVLYRVALGGLIWVLLAIDQLEPI
jgi:undecaprenyl-diphosphatase